MAIGDAPKPSNHPADYAEVLKKFKQSSTYMGELDRLVRLELAEMAEGGDPQGMREEYYKGWKDSDFKQLLADLGTPMLKTLTEEVEDSEYESLEEKRDRLNKMKKEMEFRRDVLLEAIRDSRMRAQATGLYSDYKIARDVYEEELATFIKHSLS